LSWYWLKSNFRSAPSTGTANRRKPNKKPFRM